MLRGLQETNDGIDVRLRDLKVQCSEAAVQRQSLVHSTVFRGFFASYPSPFPPPP
jgi:hypothetical protein